jgi:hypothetical protein
VLRITLPNLVKQILPGYNRRQGHIQPYVTKEEEAKKSARERCTLKIAADVFADVREFRVAR